MTQVNVSVKHGTRIDRTTSINDEFDVTSLPDFDSPSIGPLRSARSNSLQRTRVSSTTTAILLISPATSTTAESINLSLSQIGSGPLSPLMSPRKNGIPRSTFTSSRTSIPKYMENEEEAVISIQPMYPRKTCPISSRSTDLCIDHKENDFNDLNDLNLSSDSESDEDSLYAITPQIKSLENGYHDQPQHHRAVPSIQSISVCESTTSPTMSPLSMECVVNEQHELNDNDDNIGCNILSPSNSMTSVTSSCSMRSFQLQLSLDDGDSHRDSIKQQLVDRKSLKDQQRRAQSRTIHFERKNCSVVRNGNLWGRKLNAIPTKHGRQQIVEWKFATMDGIEYRRHILVLQHEQIRKKRKSKRMIMLDGTVLFCDKTKRTEWNQLRIPYCNHTLHVVIEEKDLNQLKYNYRLKIDKVPYSVAFHRWKQDQQ